MSMGQIRVYGTTWCPDCARAKKVLNEHEIPFEWIDITGNKEAIAYVEKINGGYRSVPTILFPDGSVLVEPGNAELKNKLVSMGVASPGT
ncbi:MAG: glutathione S-transferase N-terminal domain-containing protein [Chloroflexi bacterium]|nr:glutathione S-transferase N-terminal domain-containing protein [Chloroflexota bacterium]